jgi:hypothetical protein
MRRHLELALLATSVLLVTLAAPPVDGAKPPLCPSGRFAVAGDPLIGPGGELVVLENKTVTIGTVCAANKAQVKRTKPGTRVKVKFKKNACQGITGRVRLNALVTAECKQMEGTLKAKGTSTSFTAADSVCGDGVVDAGRDETCEQASDCAAGQVCNASCACEAAPVTISTAG